MQADLLFTIEQLCVRYPAVSGMYVDEGTLILAKKVEVSVSTIIEHAHPPLNLLLLDELQNKLKPFSTNAPVSLIFLTTCKSYLFLS